MDEICFCLLKYIYQVRVSTIQTSKAKIKAVMAKKALLAQIRIFVTEVKLHLYHKTKEKCL